MCWIVINIKDKFWWILLFNLRKYSKFQRDAMGGGNNIIFSLGGGNSEDRKNADLSCFTGELNMDETGYFMERNGSF